MFKIPLGPHPVYITINASGGSVGFPDCYVILRNITKKEYKDGTTDSSGQLQFDLSNFGKGYSSGDSLFVEARFGSFYQTATGTVDLTAGDNNFSLTLGAMEQGNIKIMDISIMKAELVTFLRKNLADPLNRMATYTDVFTATANQVKFQLTNTTAKAVLRVIQNSTLLTEYTQYYVDYKDMNTLNYPTVYLLTPATLNDAIEIEYTYGTSDWIYPDYPRSDIDIDSYPRVMIDFLSGNTEEMSLGAADNISSIVVSSIVWSAKSSELFDLVTKIRNLIMNNKKNFFWFNLIRPMRLSPLIKSPDRADKIVQLSQDFMIPFKVETIV